MYLNKDNETPKSSKKILIAAAAGIAVVGVATVGYVNQEDSMDFEQLASVNPAALGHKFYAEIANPCNDWYHNASKTFLKGQAAFLP